MSAIFYLLYRPAVPRKFRIFFLLVLDLVFPSEISTRRVDALELDFVIRRSLAGLVDLLLRAQRSRAHVATDEARTGVLAPLAVRQREVPIGHVVGRMGVRGERLLPFGGRSLLLRLHVAEYRQQKDEHHEGHAEADQQTEPAAEDIGKCAPVAHAAVGYHRGWRFQGPDLGALAHCSVYHEGIG